MDRIFELNLLNPIGYKKKEMTLNEMIKNALLAPTGSEFFIKYSFSFSDSDVTFTYISAGEKDPLTQEEKIQIESGRSIPIRSDEDIVIPEGKYLFEQYPDIAEEESLSRVLSSLLIAKGGENTVYVRILKENILECVMQALRPTK